MQKSNLLNPQLRLISVPSLIFSFFLSIFALILPLPPLITDFLSTGFLLFILLTSISLIALLCLKLNKELVFLEIITSLMAIVAIPFFILLGKKIITYGYSGVIFYSLPYPWRVDDLIFDLYIQMQRFLWIVIGPLALWKSIKNVPKKDPQGLAIWIIWSIFILALMILKSSEVYPTIEMISSGRISLIAVFRMLPLRLAMNTMLFDLLFALIILPTSLLYLRRSYQMPINEIVNKTKLFQYSSLAYCIVFGLMHFAIIPVGMVGLPFILNFFFAAIFCSFYLILALICWLLSISLKKNQLWSTIVILFFGIIYSLAMLSISALSLTILITYLAIADRREVNKSKNQILLYRNRRQAF